MGWLDHSSNNIIVDAVLTDMGRQAIAKNDGSFSFVKFALGDDEVDYSIIQKFGRVVGKEKIEKNTPVFEALTNQNFSQKYRCVSISNPNLARLPILEIVGTGISSNILSLGSSTSKTSSVTVTQTIQDEDSIDVELRDQAFEISLNNSFIQIQGFTPDVVDGTKTATYILRRDPVETSVGGSRLNFTVEVKSISSSQYTIFGTTSNKNLISTFMRIKGIQSGAVLEVEIQINRND